MKKSKIQSKEMNKSELLIHILDLKLKHPYHPDIKKLIALYELKLESESKVD